MFGLLARGEAALTARYDGGRKGLHLHITRALLRTRSWKVDDPLLDPHLGRIDVSHLMLPSLTTGTGCYKHQCDIEEISAQTRPLSLTLTFVKMRL